MSRADGLAAFGERLISARTVGGLTLDEAADAAALEPVRLAEAEEGSLALDERELCRLADVYGIDVTAFFGGRVTPLSYLAGA